MKKNLYEVFVTISDGYNEIEERVEIEAYNTYDAGEYGMDEVEKMYSRIELDFIETVVNLIEENISSL